MDEQALTNKSRKLQSKKDFVDKRLNNPSEEEFSNLELEYEQNIMTTDKVYLIRVFPIFILFIGLFLIFIYITFKNDTMMPLYIGIFVSLCGIILKIMMIYVEKKKKEQFLLGK